MALRALVIRKDGNKYCLMTHDGKKKLGCHDTEAEAQAQERAIKAREAAGVVEKGGKFCHATMDGGEMCHTTREEAETMVRMMRNSRDFRGAKGGDVRTVEYQGRDHLVVPVVALVEGVIHASNAETPELVLAEEFERNVEQWNGRPVMLNHPAVDGEPVSANSPEVRDRFEIGEVFHARVEDDKLKMDAYIDPARLEELGEQGQKMLAAIRDGGMVEVSVGTVVEAAPENGKKGGKPYAAVWRDIQSDHLAFLPEGVAGACSVEMGCGAPRAAAGMISHDDLRSMLQMHHLMHHSSSEQPMMPMGYVEAVYDDRYVYAEGAKLYERDYEMQDGKPIPTGEPREVTRRVVYEAASQRQLVTYEPRDAKFPEGLPEALASLADEFGEDEGFRTRCMERMEGKIDDPGAFCNWLEGHYGPRAATGRMLTAEQVGRICVECGDELRSRGLSKVKASELLKSPRFLAAVEAKVRAAGCGCSGADSTTASAEGRSMDKKARVAAIIASGKTCFKAADAAVLEQLSDDAVKALEEHVVAAGKAFPGAAPPFGKKDEDMTEEEKKAKKAKQAEDFYSDHPEIKALVDQAKLTPEQRKEAFLKENPDVGEIVAQHKAAAAKRRAELVGKLKTAQSHYKEEQLAAMPTDQLEGLAAIALKDKPSFEGAGGPRAAADGNSTEEVPAPPVMKTRILEMRKTQSGN